MYILKVACVTIHQMDYKMRTLIGNTLNCFQNDRRGLLRGIALGGGVWTVTPPPPNKSVNCLVIGTGGPELALLYLSRFFLVILISLRMFYLFFSWSFLNHDLNLYSDQFTKNIANLHP